MFCSPGILLDMPTIFEEHYICPNSGQLTSEKYCNARGIYIQEENKFLFNKVLVGQTAWARFKLINNSKVPCTLNFSVRHLNARVGRCDSVFFFSYPPQKNPIYQLGNKWNSNPCSTGVSQHGRF